MSEQYDFTETLQDLDAGIFSSKISRAVRDVAIGVSEHGRKGKVTIELDMQRIGESNQIQMHHTIKFEKPTKRGKQIEHDTTATPLYVSMKGLTFAPAAQAGFDFETE